MILYLTATERALYEKLPKELRAQWTGVAKDEEGTAWETVEQMQGHLKNLDLQKYPKVEAFAKRAWLAMQNGGSIEPLSNDMPQEALPILLHLMGAVGIATLMEQLLIQVSDVSDIDAIAHFSDVRHVILATNSVIARSLGSK